MARAIAWSPEALEDLELIAEFIERDSAFYARAVVTKLIDATRALGDFPEIGRVVPELGLPSIRERFVYSYRLIYRIEAERILVLGVIHGRRLLENTERFPQ
ncbi:type II toxin-antitoxin system RelE/ParE family toxin [Halomonas sp. ANAO-440]|uniref:type II toxin-antitoxin system RelE/ParE family toxin n=1 Tax=Halomonas sp. ANAO-440 TaxID=2861360 RepID=UPI001CAA602E|nr:type II toxin-antitoxin system RelE/ParE family toxin [Halomonas sp. ANAO-440]MBZ0331304.1 type II toxin-antitoxin system RelE/ParE family toxin [Halomonas sp. ANAO-440]